jgi:methanogenic corrinoid protein MtbC1
MMDFHTPIYVQIAQDLANGRMRNLVNGLASLDLGIDNANPVFEEWREKAARKKAVFVYCSGQHRAAMVAIPCRIVRSAAKEGNPKWSSANDHS